MIFDGRKDMKSVKSVSSILHSEFKAHVLNLLRELIKEVKQIERRGRNEMNFVHEMKRERHILKPHLFSMSR